MNFNDPLYESKTNACPICLRVQFVEQTKDAVIMLRGNTDAIVRYMKEEEGIPAFDLKLPYEVEGET